MLMFVALPAHVLTSLPPPCPRFALWGAWARPDLTVNPQLVLTVEQESSDGTLCISGYRVHNSFERDVAVGEIRKSLVRGHCRGWWVGKHSAPSPHVTGGRGHRE